MCAYTAHLAPNRPLSPVLPPLPCCVCCRPSPRPIYAAAAHHPRSDVKAHFDQSEESPFAGVANTSTAAAAGLGSGEMSGGERYYDVEAGADGSHDHEAPPLPAFEALQPVFSCVVTNPLTMEWQGMGCVMTSHGRSKQTLKNVWGRAVPGEMQVGGLVLSAPGRQGHDCGVRLGRPVCQC